MAREWNHAAFSDFLNSLQPAKLAEVLVHEIDDGAFVAIEESHELPELGDVVLLYTVLKFPWLVTFRE